MPTRDIYEMDLDSPSPLPIPKPRPKPDRQKQSTTTQAKSIARSEFLSFHDAAIKLNRVPKPNDVWTGRVHLSEAASDPDISKIITNQKQRADYYEATARLYHKAHSFALADAILSDDSKLPDLRYEFLIGQREGWMNEAGRWERELKKAQKEVEELRGEVARLKKGKGEKGGMPFRLSQQGGQLGREEGETESDEEL